MNAVSCSKLNFKRLFFGYFCFVMNHHENSNHAISCIPCFDYAQTRRILTISDKCISSSKPQWCIILKFVNQNLTIEIPFSKVRKLLLSWLIIKKIFKFPFRLQLPSLKHIHFSRTLSMFVVDFAIEKSIKIMIELNSKMWSPNFVLKL